MAVMLAQARSASSSKVPGTNFPSVSSAGIPLMYNMPFSPLARLNGKPAGSPGPELIRLIVMSGLAGGLFCRASDHSGRHLRRRLVEDAGAGGEVQARVAAADGAEPQARLERDVTAVEEPLACLVAGAEGGAVEPGEVGGLGRVPGQHGQALAQQVSEQDPPA